jgi:putative sterol carrier protein
MNSSEFFQTYFPKKLSENPKLLVASGVKAGVVGLSVEGSGEWAVVFDAEGGATVKSGADAAAFCTIQLNEKAWDGLFAGTLNVPMAIMMRKIKIHGSLDVAAKFGSALKSAFRT